jgi:hypothetical protein
MVSSYSLNSRGIPVPAVLSRTQAGCFKRWIGNKARSALHNVGYRVYLKTMALHNIIDSTRKCQLGSPSSTLGYIACKVYYTIERLRIRTTNHNDNFIYVRMQPPGEYSEFKRFFRRYQILKQNTCTSIAQYYARPGGQLLNYYL